MGVGREVSLRVQNPRLYVWLCTHAVSQHEAQHFQSRLEAVRQWSQAFSENRKWEGRRLPQVSEMLPLLLVTQEDSHLRRERKWMLP